MNWEEACQILGVAVTATAAEMKTRWLDENLLRAPDKTINLPESVRQRAEEELKHINAAYDFLKDSKNRLQHVPLNSPPKLSISPQRIRFKDVEPGQRKTTTIKIESVGGSYTKFWMDDSPAAWLKVVEVKSTTNDPLPLEATLEAANNGSLRGQAACSLLIRLEDEKTRAKDEVTVKVELWAKAVVRHGILSKIGSFFGGAKSTPTYVPPSSPPKPSPRGPRGGYRGRLPQKIYLGNLVTGNAWHPVDFDNLRRWVQRAKARLDSGEELRGSHFMYRMNFRLGTYEIRLRSKYTSCRYKW
jgi:hypothetical protein